MRRLIVEEPVSRPALWSPLVAWFAIAVTGIALALARFQLVDLTAAGISIASGVALAATAVLFAFMAFVRIWTEGRRGLGSAVWGLLLALLVLAYPLYFAALYVLLPRINDISTDLDSPPAFSRSQAALQARGGRVPPDPSPEDRSKQREAYPQVAPLTLDVAPEEAYDLVRQAAQNRGWQIVEAARPGGRIGLGRLDAIDRTLLLRFPDDITVRLRPRADGTRIDVRSASRLGNHDFGQNARRIRRFLDEVSNLAIAAK